jgi:glucosamine--fructose-6-phosphate aminotransferase (isomerizing)
MFDSLELISSFDFSRTYKISRKIWDVGKLLLTGEGSSRIFPAKNFLYQLRKSLISAKLNAVTEGCYQSLEYDLADWYVIAASNSGQTGEAVELYKHLQELNHCNNFVVTASENAKLSELAAQTLVLKCGAENAVAATKSVIEQALTYLSIFYNLKEIAEDCPKKNQNNCNDNKSKDTKSEELRVKLEKLSVLGRQVLSVKRDSNLVELIANANTLFVAGRNDGAAEELALKATEITRKRSIYLEGTFLLHGIEEIISENDVVILVEPFMPICKKIQELFVEKHNISVISISKFPTPFPTIQIPELSDYDQFLQLFAGWNLLVEAALHVGINPDKPIRARKIGNKFE